MAFGPTVLVTGFTQGFVNLCEVYYILDISIVQ